MGFSVLMMGLSPCFFGEKIWLPPGEIHGSNIGIRDMETFVDENVLLSSLIYLKYHVNLTQNETNNFLQHMELYMISVGVYCVSLIYIYTYVCILYNIYILVIPFTPKMSKVFVKSLFPSFWTPSHHHRLHTSHVFGGFPLWPCRCFCLEHILCNIAGHPNLGVCRWTYTSQLWRKYLTYMG